jgi:PLP dependent protein
VVSVSGQWAVVSSNPERLRTDQNCLSISQNIARVREQIDSAARRAGREPQSVTLMAVTKTVSPELIREAYEAGVRVFGENRMQEFAAKHDALGDLKDAEWHMVGHLQSNKAHAAAELFHAIDSIDSVRLLQRLNSAAKELGKALLVLIEINIGGEAAKSGIAPESSELEEMLNFAETCGSIKIRGLMAVPPYDDDPEKSRPYFRKMRALFEQIAARRLPAVNMQTLSMGMSHDFEVAIEEGSTCVRVGTAIFGKRQKV